MARVLLFGRLADAAGWRERSVDAPTTVGALRAALAQGTPEIAAATTRAALNHEMVTDAATVAPGDEVAFMPPLSGG
jgi:molybdopterin synthase sulfur carrier subunit